MQYQDFEHGRVYLGNCEKIIDDIGAFSHIITDPPYGMIEQSWDKALNINFIKELLDKKRCENCIIFGNEPFSSYVRMGLIGFYRYDQVWIKSNKTLFVHAKNQPMRRFENVMVFSSKVVVHKSLDTGNRMTYNPQGLEPCNITYNGKHGFVGVYGARKSHKDKVVQDFTGYPDNVLEFAKDKESWHPTQKPIALMEHLIKTYSNENEIILDPFLGSGTTAIACINTNRRFVGVELDPSYFEQTCQRIQYHYDNFQLNLFKE